MLNAKADEDYIDQELQLMVKIFGKEINEISNSTIIVISKVDEVVPTTLAKIEKKIKK